MLKKKLTLLMLLVAPLLLGVSFSFSAFAKPSRLLEAEADRLRGGTSCTWNFIWLSATPVYCEDGRFCSGELKPNTESETGGNAGATTKYCCTVPCASFNIDAVCEGS